jgi:hypothetical protein
MNKIILLVFTFIVLSASSGFTQNRKEIVAVVNKAEWCPTCKANDQRVADEVLSQYKSSDVTVAWNDLTNDKTKGESKDTLEKLGVYSALQHENKTGQLIIIDKKTKKVITKISVAKSTEELKAALDEAIKQS